MFSNAIAHVFNVVQIIQQGEFHAPTVSYLTLSMQDMNTLSFILESWTPKITQPIFNPAHSNCWGRSRWEMSPEDMMPWMTSVSVNTDVFDLDLSSYQSHSAGQGPPSGGSVFHIKSRSHRPLMDTQLCVRHINSLRVTLRCSRY